MFLAFLGTSSFGIFVYPFLVAFHGVFITRSVLSSVSVITMLVAGLGICHNWSGYLSYAGIRDTLRSMWALSKLITTSFPPISTCVSSPLLIPILYSAVKASRHHFRRLLGVPSTAKHAAFPFLLRRQLMISASKSA